MTWLSVRGEAGLAVPAVRLAVGADGSSTRARQLTGALYLIARAFGGDPIPPREFSGALVSRNS
jgi:hypothetical protein